MKILNELEDKDESFAAAASRKAGLYYQQGRQAEAYTLIDQVLKQEPNNAQVMVVKGGWLLAEKKLELALVQARSAVRANPNLATAQSLLGTLQLALGKIDDGIEALNRVLAISPRDLKAQLLLSASHLAAGRPDQALQFAQEAIKNQPLSGRARVAAARALLATGSPARAEEELAPVIVAAPNDAEFRTLMGQIQYRQGDRDDARESFERATTLDRKALTALAGLLQIDANAKQFDRAQQRVERELAASPNDAALLLIAARTYTAATNLPRAEELARRAINANPSSFDGYHLLGQLYVRQNKLAEALKEYEAVAKQQPSNVAARTMVGMLLQVQNRQDEAKRQFEAILAIDPRAAVAANNLAYLHAEAGTNLDTALNLAQTAKSGLPEDPNVSDTLGWVYYKRNLSATAVDAFQQSIKKDPANAVYYYHLGLALLQSKDEAGARAAFERALQLKLQPKEAAEARKALASIRG